MDLIEICSTNDFTALQEEHPDSLIILFFYSDHCPNCKRLKPEIKMTLYELQEPEHQDILKKHPVSICQLKYPTVPEVTKKMDIMGVPTMVFIHDKKVIYRFSGLTDSAHLTKKILSLVSGDKINGI